MRLQQCAKALIPASAREVGAHGWQLLCRASVPAGQTLLLLFIHDHNGTRTYGMQSVWL